MKVFKATININATPETIWQILTNAARYPAWDKTMDHIEGTLALGEKVTFHTKLSEQAFPVKVTTFDAPRQMVLTGGMPLGLFKTERTHTLTPNNDGSTTFHTEEIFSGLLLPIFGRTIPDLNENFAGFAAALKVEAEK